MSSILSTMGVTRCAAIA